MNLLLLASMFLPLAAIGGYDWQQLIIAIAIIAVVIIAINAIPGIPAWGKQIGWVIVLAVVAIIAIKFLLSLG